MERQVKYMKVGGIKNFAVMFAATSAIATLLPSPVRAQGSNIYIRNDIDKSIWSDVVVGPNDPLRFAGEGAVHAIGEGDAKIYIKQGSAKSSGIGVVGIKTTHDSVSQKGWDGKETVGDWTFYWGEGEISIKGDEYNIVSYLMPGYAEIEGQADTSFKGNWALKVAGFNKTIFEQILTTLIPNWIREKIGR